MTNALRTLDVVLIIDEYDRTSSQQLNQRLADTIKALSDENSPCKFLVVGVAPSVDVLIGEHRSIERSLCQILLQRMSREELHEIVNKGESVLKVEFDPGVKNRIVGLSDGLPYFTQLIAYYAVTAWARDGRGAVIGLLELRAGLGEAVSNATETLRSGYAQAIKTVKSTSQRFRNVLWACAMPEEVEVQAQQIAQHVSTIEQKKVRLLAFSYHLSELTKGTRGQILTRVSKGWYKFSNPLMRGYVRLQMEYDNLLYHDGQMLFPFMK